MVVAAAAADRARNRMLGALEQLTTCLTTQAQNQAAKEEAERVAAQRAKEGKGRKEEIAAMHAKFSENTQSMVKAMQEGGKEFMKGIRGASRIPDQTPAQCIRPRSRLHGEEDEIPYVRWN